MSMKFKLFTISLLTAMTLVGCNGDTKMKGKDVTFVNINKVLSESVIQEQEQERNNLIKNILDKAQKDASKAYAEMTPEQQAKSKTSDAIILNRQLILEKRHSRNVSLQVITKAIEDYRKNNGISVVLNSDSVIAIDPAKDISSDIIKLLKDEKVSYGDLPKITIKNISKKVE